MANTIELAKIYTTLCDTVYKEDSKTADLDANEALISQGVNANEIVVPMIDMQGLGDYSRNSGYVNGDVDVTFETIKADYDRGRKFTVDNLDDAETGGVAFGMLAGEFIRTKVIPELDAKRFANYASQENVTTVNGATLETGEEVVSALRAATNTMDEDEVSMEDRILYITPTCYGLIQDLETTKSREVLARFSKIVTVPQSRFYTDITLNDGSTAGQEAGGFAGAGSEINFMVIQKSAVVQAIKHVAPKIIAPEVNNDADAWAYGYRIVGVAKVYENKLAGVYVNTK